MDLKKMGGLLGMLAGTTVLSPEEAEAGPISRFFRFHRGDSPMSSWGHAMFRQADSPQEADEILSVYGKDVYELFPTDKYAEIGDLKNDILKAYAQSYKKGTLPYDMERLVTDREFKADNFFSQFSPDDIVDSAAAYDNDDYLSWFWENVISPKGLDGVITPDGAISFNPDDIKKIYTKPSAHDGIPDSVKGFIPVVGAGAAALAPGEAQASAPVDDYRARAIPADQYPWPADEPGFVAREPGLETPLVDVADLATAPIGAVTTAGRAAAVAAEPFIAYGMDKAGGWLGDKLGGMLGYFGWGD